jgi:hypothetical protein
MSGPWWANFFLHDRIGKLILVFASFVLLQLLFAGVYFWLYRVRWSNFSFNADILRDQTTMTSERTAAQFELLQRAAAVLDELRKALEAGAEPTKENGPGHFVALASGSRAVITHHARAPYGPTSSFTVFELRAPDSTTLFHTTVGLPTRAPLSNFLRTAAEWLEVLPGIMAELQGAYAKADRRLKSLSTKAPDIWSYWDFLYFSTIVRNHGRLWRHPAEQYGSSTRRHRANRDRLRTPYHCPQHRSRIALICKECNGLLTLTEFCNPSTNRGGGSNHVPREMKVV